MEDRAIEGLKMAYDLCDKSWADGGMAKSPAMFLTYREYVVYKMACEEYRDTIGNQIKFYTR